MIQMGYKIGNISNSILFERIKLSSYRDNMIKAISSILEVDMNVISIHFGTSEQLGFIGRKKGIYSSSTILIFKNFW